MGKFTDTNYTNTVDKLISATKDAITNPYYMYSDKKPTAVTYYAQNIEKSTLDEASGLNEAHIGKGSPIKFNKIENFFLYGIDRIGTETDLGEYGIEVSSIEGDAIILPNTITPREGDFFSIKYVKEDILFRVNNAVFDTLDTGANIWRIEYKFDQSNAKEKLDKQVVKNFKFLVNNVGTDFKALIQDSDFDLVERIEGIIEGLITYFENIFFDSRLQTFVFNHDGWHMYDPFMIEFFIRNKVMNYGEEYLFVSHATSTNKTFGMDYRKTIFNMFETKDISRIKKVQHLATADLITDPNSLFVTRIEDYYSINYCDAMPYKTRFSVIPTDVLEHIEKNFPYSKGSKNEFYNLWIAYFNNEKDFVTSEFIDTALENTNYMDNLSSFYGLAFSIYILERYIGILMTK